MLMYDRKTAQYCKVMIFQLKKKKEKIYNEERTCPDCKCQTDRNPKIGQTMINQVKAGVSKRGSNGNSIAIITVPTFNCYEK